MTKQELLSKLRQSEELLGSTSVPVSQVITWLNELQDSVSLSENKIEEIAQIASDELDSYGIDLIDDYDLEMHYKEVELSSVNLNNRQVKEIIIDVLRQELNVGD